MEDTWSRLAARSWELQKRLLRPLRPILFLLRDEIDSRNNSSECLFPESTPETSTCSHSIGTLSALKMVLTDSATSAPMPSPISQAQHVLFNIPTTVCFANNEPGISVTVYFPPNFVGLKMSLWTVAMPNTKSASDIICHECLCTHFALAWDCEGMAKF